MPKSSAVRRKTDKTVAPGNVPHYALTLLTTPFDSIRAGLSGHDAPASDRVVAGSVSADGLVRNDADGGSRNTNSCKQLADVYRVVAPGADVGARPISGRLGSADRTIRR